MLVDLVVAKESGPHLEVLDLESLTLFFVLLRRVRRKKATAESKTMPDATPATTPIMVATLLLFEFEPGLGWFAGVC